MMALLGQAQTVTISVSGKVSDKTQPLPGVSVVVQNSTVGTATQADGSFQLQVPATAKALVVSSVGYVSQTIPLTGQSSIQVTLAEDAKALDEVVVVGYGTQRKQDLTGAVAIADIEALKAQPAASATEALQGKVAGVNIVNDGSPGSTPQIRIRGYSTINNNEPLYVIDGVPYQGQLSWFNQSDIQTLQVLKDASAASIYGSRANNGVVIITTKRGKDGPSEITFDSYYGVSTPVRSRFPEFLTPQQYADYLFQGYTNAGLNPGDYLGDQYGRGATAVLPEYLRAGSVTGQNVTPADADPARYSNDPNNYYQITRASREGTDWMRAITRSAPVQSYQLGATGGSKNTAYALSIGYQDQQGILKYTDFKRYSLRANVQTAAFNNRLRFGENMLFSRTEGTGFSTSNTTPGDYLVEDNPVNSVYKQQTIIPLYDIAGNFAGSQGTGLGDGKQP
ncbi:MAG: SusC/RagA family TonB-linked outer membrane protein, partial [Hymenobacter sp.]|nr:SusC/RagA family TonB-linked outer membrane protein [Hymenobacter sp.]